MIDKTDLEFIWDESFPFSQRSALNMHWKRNEYKIFAQYYHSEGYQLQNGVHWSIPVKSK